MATECSNAALYSSLGFCKGKPLLPGIRTRVYYIPKSDIVKFPTLPDKATENMASLATYTGSFELEAEKKWKYIDLIDNKGKIESESQGDKPARTFLNKTSVVHPKRTRKPLASAVKPTRTTLSILCRYATASSASSVTSPSAPTPSPNKTAAKAFPATSALRWKWRLRTFALRLTTKEKSLRKTALLTRPRACPLPPNPHLRC